MGMLDYLPETTEPHELEEREHLEEVLRNVIGGRSEEARGEAVRAFVKSVGDGRAIELLIDTFQTKGAAAVETPITMGAVRALRVIGEPAVEPLIEALQNEIPTMRKRAAIALGEIGDKRAVEPLTSLLGDKKSFVREATEDALEKLGEGERW